MRYVYISLKQIYPMILHDIPSISHFTLLYIYISYIPLHTISFYHISHCPLIIRYIIIFPASIYPLYLQYIPIISLLSPFVHIPIISLSYPYFISLHTSLCIPITPYMIPNMRRSPTHIHYSFCESV